MTDIGNILTSINWPQVGMFTLINTRLYQAIDAPCLLRAMGSSFTALQGGGAICEVMSIPNITLPAQYVEFGKCKKKNDPIILNW